MSLDTRHQRFYHDLRFHLIRPLPVPAASATGRDNFQSSLHGEAPSESSQRSKEPIRTKAGRSGPSAAYRDEIVGPNMSSPPGYAGGPRSHDFCSDHSGGPAQRCPRPVLTGEAGPGSCRHTGCATYNTSARKPRSSVPNPPSPSSGRSTLQPAAVSSQSRRACVAYLPLRSSSFSTKIILQCGPVQGGGRNSG